MTEMFDNIVSKMVADCMFLADEKTVYDVREEAARSLLTSLLEMPEDIIAVGMNALLDDGQQFVISKDVTVPFYAVIHAILGDEDNGN